MNRSRLIFNCFFKPIAYSIYGYLATRLIAQKEDKSSTVHVEVHNIPRPCPLFLRRAFADDHTPYPIILPACKADWYAAHRTIVKTLLATRDNDARKALPKHNRISKANAKKKLGGKTLLVRTSSRKQ